MSAGTYPAVRSRLGASTVGKQPWPPYSGHSRLMSLILQDNPWGHSEPACRSPWCGT